MEVQPTDRPSFEHSNEPKAIDHISVWPAKFEPELAVLGIFLRATPD